MKTCPKCGLPKTVCRALAAYRMAIELFHKGDDDLADHYLKIANNSFIDYFNERDGHDSMLRH